MSVSKRVIAMLVCICLLGWGLWAAKTQTMAEDTIDETVDKDSLIIWYTDDSLTDYISAACVSYNELYGTRVVPKLQSGDGYLELVNSVSIENDGTPDLYLITHDELERAYLCGLASKIEKDTTVVNEDSFPQAALASVTYKGTPVAYPFYFETTALLYNKTYLTEMATNQVLAEESDEPNEIGGELYEEEEIDEETEKYNALSHDEKIAYKLEQSIPDNFDELLEFANTCDAPQEVDAIFKWDVKDIFYNYFFVGNYINVGGPNGDDLSCIDIYNMDAVTALTVYQDLNQFFSFDYEDISYESVIDEFINGKIVFTTATSDIVNRLETAKSEGNFEYEYGVAGLPDTSDILVSRGMSVTNTVVINGYSDKRDKANSFAKYLTVDYANNLYEMTGKIPASGKISFVNEAIRQYVAAYADSVPIPKMMATSNYWLQAEITFANVWAGKSVSDELKNLSEQIKEQVTGMEISEDYIDIPVETPEETEYYDEDVLKEAAQQEEQGDE